MAVSKMAGNNFTGDAWQIAHHTSLLKSIKIRQMRFLGHVIRKEQLEHLSLTRLIAAKRARGRQRQAGT